MNPSRVEGKKVSKFDIGDFIEVKYKYPEPQGNIQKQLVGHKLKERVQRAKLPG